jgi:hypothetical protein
MHVSFCYNRFLRRKKVLRKLSHIVLLTIKMFVFTVINMRVKIYTTSSCYAFYNSSNAKIRSSYATGQYITGTYKLPQIY